MENSMVQLGVGGALAFLIIERVLTFLLKWRGKHHNGSRPLDGDGDPVERRRLAEPCRRMTEQVDHLHALFTSELPGIMDREREVLGHVRTYEQKVGEMRVTDTMLNEAINRLSTNVEHQSDALRDVAQSTSTACAAIGIVQEKLTHLSFGITKK